MASDPPDSSDRFEPTLSKPIAGVLAGDGTRVKPGRAYLMVLEGDTSLVHELPWTGSVVIGRAKDAELQLRDGGVSRQHARLTLSAGHATVTDLGSHNGTYVNDERITAPCSLASGDVLTICDAILVLHSSAKTTAPVALVELAQFRRSADIELERSLRYGAPLAVVAILGAGSVERATIQATIESRLRVADQASWASPELLVLLLPELGADEACDAARRILEMLATVAPDARAGVAVCPHDGSELDALLSSARAAVATAEAGAVSLAAQAYRELPLGDVTVLLADPVMIRLYGLVERLAASDISVLVGGETGTGKELVARAVHHFSARRHKPFRVLNAAAVPESLVESELFGHERGAFTGAVAAKAGLFESAQGGTVFLDEVGELPLHIQPKLLRVLENRRVVRVGDVRERDVDVRVVAATNRDLDRDVEAGRFRADLFYRLCGGRVWIPPLRDRPREIALLAQAFLQQACGRLGRPTMTLSAAAVHVLAGHSWPGNLRELKNLVEYAAAASPDAMVDEALVAERLGIDLSRGRTSAPSAPPAVPAAAPLVLTPASAPPGATAFRPIDEELRALERARMEQALAAAAGNKTRAAELIGMPIRTFMRKCEQYGLGRR